MIDLWTYVIRVIANLLVVEPVARPLPRDARNNVAFRWGLLSPLSSLEFGQKAAKTSLGGTSSGTRGAGGSSSGSSTNATKIRTCRICGGCNLRRSSSRGSSRGSSSGGVPLCDSHAGSEWTCQGGVAASASMDIKQPL